MPAIAMVLALARADPLIFRMCCGEKAAPPISYTGTTSTRVYSVHDISDVSLIVGQQAPFLCGCCCCEEIYESSVRVRFGDFSKQDNTASLHVGSITSFQDKVNTQFGKTVNIAGGITSGLMGLFSNIDPDFTMLQWVDIVSFREDDAAMDLEHPHLKDGFEALVAVQRQLSTVITSHRTPVWAPTTLAVHLPNTKHEVTLDTFADLGMVCEGECTLPST